jgi:penicillin-binding protein 1C
MAVLIKTGSWAGAALILHVAGLLLVLNLLFAPVLTRKDGACVVVDKAGLPLRAFADARGVWRFPARPDQVSPLYLEALLTYEDRWFHYHFGVNPLALARAAFQNAVNGRVVSGGSTITMQVARILFRPQVHHHPLVKKMGQILRALQLEACLSKAEILGLYLTHAPFGANIQGVRAAAHTWLGKDADDLTHAEAALLAVLPQAPSRYRPDRHPKRAAEARDKVLDRLVRFGIWQEETVALARQEPVVPFRFPSPMTAPLAARRLKQQHPGTFVIPTFIDADLQRHVAHVLQGYAAGLAPGQSGAVMVVDTRTMAVRAYAGSANFFSRLGQGHVDMIQAFRSPGSTLKPFIYGLALDEGLIHSHSMLLDTPRIGKSYDPGNFTGGFQGPVTVEQALRKSLNLPAVQILEQLGPGNCHDRLRHAGAMFRFAGRPNLSMALGGVGTDMESLVTLYAALARRGMGARPRLTPAEPLSDRYLMSPGAAYIIRKILSRPFPGQAGVARLCGDWPVAWKTGTSYGFRDAWALGLKGHYLAGVWIGRPDGSPSPGQYGAVTAVPLLATILEGLDRGPGPGTAPASITQAEICWPSGLSRNQLEKRGALPKGACVRQHKAWILDHQVPLTMTNSQGLAAPLIQTFRLDARGLRASSLCGGTRQRTFAFWPWQAEPYIPKAWQRAQRMPAPSARCPNLAPPVMPGIRIVSVADGSILRRQPGDRGHVMVPLRAIGGRGRLYWFLNRRALDRDTAMPMPEPGRHQLAVSDGDGNADMVAFKVVASDQ